MADPNSERLGKPIRRHVRIEVQVGIRFVIDGDASATTYEALTKNLSRGGVCLMAHEGKDRLIAAAAGRMPRLQVSLYVGGSDGPIDVQTQTAWISSKIGWFMTPSRQEMPVLVGMSFEDLSAEDGEKIDAFIEASLFNGRESVQDLESRLLPRPVL